MGTATMQVGVGGTGWLFIIGNALISDYSVLVLPKTKKEKVWGTFDIAPVYEEIASQKRWCMARVVRDLTVLLAHPRVYTRTVWTMPLPSQPKLVLILPTPEGWKAEST